MAAIWRWQLCARHGEHIDQVIAVGVEGLHQTHKFPLNMDTQWGKLAIMAAQDPAIREFVPDLTALLKRVLKKLAEKPMMVEFQPHGSDEMITVPISDYGLQTILRRDIGDASDIPVFPKLLYTIDQGDPSVLEWFVRRRWHFSSINLMGLFMDGASGASAERWAMIRRQTAGSMFGQSTNGFWPEVDRATGVKDLGEPYRAPLVSDIRTLFLTGSLDFNTPPYQAEQIRWGMPNATHIVVENAGHEQIIPNPEVQQTMMRFLMGEEVRDVTIVAPPIKFIPIKGDGTTSGHPSVAGN